MYCCIRSCPAKYGKAAVSFHRFPQNNETRRQRWIEAAGRGNCINYDYAMICSRHFVGGRPARVSDCDSVSWVPTLLLDKGLSDVAAMAQRQSVDSAGVVDGGSIHDDDGEEVNCAVRGCGMTKEENPSLLFFSVPRDADDRRKWLLQIGMLNNAIKMNRNKLLAVCELHFDLAKDLLNYDDVITMGRSAMLKDHVMPTRNIPTVFGYQKVRFTHEVPDNPPAIQQEPLKPEEEDDDDDDVTLLEEMGERNGDGHGMPEYPSHMQPSPIEEFVQICRSCLSMDKTNLVSAYDDRLAEIFFQFTNVNIDDNDGISTMICVDCKSRLLDIHFFRDTCVTNTQILIHRYQKCYGMAPDGGHIDQRQNNEIMQYNDEENTSQNVQSPTKYNRYDMGADDPEDLLMPQKEEVETPVAPWKPRPGRPRKQHKPVPAPSMVPMKIVPQVATMKKKFKCKFCRKEYNSRPGFDMHMATHKYHSQSEFIVECKRCDVRSRKNEVHRCYTDILYCYVCGEQYRKWSYLKIHLAKVHKIKTKRRELMQKLKEMGYVGGSRANALKIPPSNRRIPQDYSDNEVEITEPVEDPDSEKSNSAHSDRSTPTDQRPKCSFCGVCFRQNSCLEMHMKTHSAIELTQCNECDLNFDAYRHLERHHEDHDDENPGLDSGVKCRLCGKKLKRNQTLLLHYQYVHKDKDVVQCSNCPQLVENATQLARHTCSGNQRKIKIVSSSSTATAKTTNGDFVIIQPESILKGAPRSITMNDDSNSVPVGLQGGDGADPLLGLGNDEVIELDSDDDDKDDESSREKSNFNCSVCGKTFEKEDTLDRHMKLHRMMNAAKANEIGLRNCFFRAMNCRREVSQPSF